MSTMTLEAGALAQQQRLSALPVPAGAANPVLSVSTFGAEHLDAALAVVEKYNRRAERSGIAARLETVHSRATIAARTTDYGLQIAAHDVVTFVVLGEPLKISGWEFVATVTFDPDAGVVTRTVPGAVDVDLSFFREIGKPVCQHCNTTRARRDTYVLRNELGWLKVVGRNCLAAFLGLDPSRALWFVGDEFGRRLHGGFGGFGYGETRFHTDALLAVASAVIAEHGWVPRSAGGMSTAELVLTALCRLPGRETERLSAAIQARLDESGGPSAALERARAARAWVVETETLFGEYGANLKAVVSADTVSQKNVPLAVSALNAWARHTSRELERREQQDRFAASEHVGQVGERLRRLRLEVVLPPKFLSGDYGTSTLLTMCDDDGNVLKWFASGSHDLAVGTVLVGAGTVKKHEIFAERKSTVLTRCSLQPQ